VSKKVKEKVMNIFSNFMHNYRKGCERFGFWWTLFTASMLSIAAIFILFAIILAVLYLK
jgi:hypothetical protein